MRRYSIRGTLGVVALAAVGACTGDLTSPPTTVSGPALASSAPFSTPLADVIVDHMAADSLSADFTVTPTGGWFRMGNHGIFFPDHSICEPSSTYGETEWDQPCVPLDTAIQIHAEVRTQDGRSWVDFTPALRFVPSDDPNQWVQIYLYTDAATDTTNLADMTVLWSAAIGEPGIDEAASDSTQRTYVDPEKGYAFRRIKHFSGYNVSVGRLSTEDTL